VKSPSRRSEYGGSSSSGSRRHIAKPEVIDDVPANSAHTAGTTLEGKRAGLQKASDLRKEMVDFRRKENEMFSTVRDFDRIVTTFCIA